MTAPAPRWASEFETLASIAGDLIARRTLKYPEAVENGTISAEQAADGLRIMGAIAYDWRRHIDLVRLRKPAMVAPPPGSATRAERIATLEAAASRAARIAESKPGDLYAAEYAELVETLLWWEREPCGIRFITDTNLALRDRDRADRESAAA